MQKNVCVLAEISWEMPVVSVGIGISQEISPEFFEATADPVFGNDAVKYQVLIVDLVLVH